MNERVTEDIIREHFKRDPLFDVIKLEEQKTNVAQAKKCLATASKHQTGQPGYPDFIVTFPAFSEDILIVECKADAQSHESLNRDQPVDYAVDGVLHYPSFLCSEYNVFSIAISGTENLEVSSFYQKKGEGIPLEQDDQLLSIFSYLSKIKGKSVAENIESEEITKLAIELNKELNDYSIVEYERCTLVSAILFALQDESFRKSYQAQARTQQLKARPDRLAKSIVDAINRVLEESDIEDASISTIISEYQTIRNKTLTKEAKIKKKKASVYQDNFVIRDLTERLESKILPLIRMGEKGHDVLGRFYREFIRYAGTDQKTGLVLTPKHITEFFCEIVYLDKEDVVFDACCGSGGFLVSAMKYMLALAGNDEEKKTAIKHKQLIGIEKRTDMFTFACSNMMMSGDGKSNIYQGDSFDNEIKTKIKNFRPTVAFLNPPYDVGEDGQLEFIENALSCLEKGGRCVAIVQMSCATSTGKSAIRVRERLLKNNTLKAVFSMPNDLFHPIGVVTCVMVFEAGNKHPDGFKSYFGYYKEDGFVKRKHLGRMDSGDWPKIKKIWLERFINRENVAGLSITHEITAKDEWCAESYMETDYSTLTEEDFIKTIKDYMAFQFLHQDKFHQ